MADEIETGSAGAANGGGPAPSRDGFSSPLQARAPFLKNWDWESVTGVNRGTCERGGAQYGFNSETHRACSSDWEKWRSGTLSLGETLDLLRSFHRRAPFLFYNGNTFATIGRELSLALFSDLPPVRKREISSAVGHYIAGVLDREAVVQIVEELSQAASFRIGDHVKTLRGNMRGRVINILQDGRVQWRVEGTGSELIALPESLLPEK
jgi:hypothetical protein